MQYGGSEQEADLWAWTREHSPGYPKGKWVKTLTPPKKKETARYLLAGEIVGGSTREGEDARPTAFVLADAFGLDYNRLDDPTTYGTTVSAALHHHYGSGVYVCFQNGAKRDFHIFLRHIAPTLLPLGWEIQPMASGSDILGIRLRHDKREWYWTDLSSTVGAEVLGPTALLQDFGETATSQGGNLLAYYRAICRLQDWLLTTFGIALRPSLGSLAVKVASKHIPSNVKWWRPHPFLVSICRNGFAYRGGLVYGEPYRGQAWQIDCNKLYTWALSQPLPYQYAIGRCVTGKGELPGFFLTHVAGKGHFPTTLPAWSPDFLRYGKQSTSNGTGWAWLPQEESVTLRKVGYTVQPGFGLVATGHLDLSPFARQLGQLESIYPRGTTQHHVCKMLGNAFYGKLAEKPNRTDVRYSLDWPGKGWWPYLTIEGQIAEHLWVQPVERHRPYHHVDAAAIIAARARSRMLEVLSDLTYRGIRVVHCDTDGAILDADPSTVLPLDPSELGAFRVVQANQPCVVIRRKVYYIGSEIRTAGARGIAPEQLEMVASGHTVSVARNVLHAPWDAARDIEPGLYVLRG